MLRKVVTVRAPGNPESRPGRKALKATGWNIVGEITRQDILLLLVGGSSRIANDKIFVDIRVHWDSSFIASGFDRSGADVSTVRGR